MRAPSKTLIRERITALRELMKEHNLAAYYIPGTDPHISEYIPAHWQRREWMSGFTGSNGELVVTLEQAGLWTDGRYFLQAELELEETGIALFKLGVKDEVSIQTWLRKTLNQGDRVGIDPQLVSCHKAHELIEELEKKAIIIDWLEDNLVDKIWYDRPALPQKPFIPHPLAYAGESAQEKLAKVRFKMQEEGVQIYVLNSLDAIAWLFNIRGEDIEYNPVVIAYAIITAGATHLFVRSVILTEASAGYLREFAEINEYADFKNRLQVFIDHQGTEKKRVWIDPVTTTYWIENLLNEHCHVLYKDDPVTRLKAVKNQTEIAGFRKAHIRDGVAMVRFLCWLDKAIQAVVEPGERTASPDNRPGNRLEESSVQRTAKLTEQTAQEKLLHFRREQELFRFPSFNTIAGYKEHGAIIHYHSTAESDCELRAAGLMLLDSGGQYLDGTTDITRTITLGQVQEEEKKYYTCVLKGYLNLSTTSFPESTKGIQLDTLARQNLWNLGEDYGHGTGHGVGSYLNVHEGPHAISPTRLKQVPLEEGMFVSLEPGYYQAGKFGIRLENLAIVAKNPILSGEAQTFFSFEIVTLCPFDRRLIDVHLLLPEERQQINLYHQRVYETLVSYLPDEERGWLKAATRPL